MFRWQRFHSFCQTIQCSITGKASMWFPHLYWTWEESVVKTTRNYQPKLREDRLINIWVQVNISFFGKKLVTAYELVEDPIVAKLRFCNWVWEIVPRNWCIYGLSLTEFTHRSSGKQRCYLPANHVLGIWTRSAFLFSKPQDNFTAFKRLTIWRVN